MELSNFTGTGTHEIFKLERREIIVNILQFFNQVHISDLGVIATMPAPFFSEGYSFMFI